MSVAVRGVMNRLETHGPALVEDNTIQYLAENRDVMEPVYQETHQQILAPVKEGMQNRPDLMRAYERNQAVREDLAARGMETDRIHVGLASDVEGNRLPIAGKASGRTAQDIFTDMSKAGADTRALWKEMYERAGSDYSDNNVAKAYMGWLKTDESGLLLTDDSGEYIPTRADQWRHPVGQRASMRYADMQLDDVERIAEYGSYYPDLQSRANQYLEQYKAARFPHQGKVYQPIESGDDDFARRALNREYIPEEEFIRPPQGENRPSGNLRNTVNEGASGLRKTLSEFWEKGHGKAAALVGGALLAGGIVFRQATRGNVLEDQRPQHDAAPNADGMYSKKESSAPYTGPAPSTQTYLTDGSHYNVNIRAKNPGHVQHDEIGGALQQSMAGRQASINVHHRDDTSTIGSDWLQQKFSELLGNGRVSSS